MKVMVSKFNDPHERYAGFIESEVKLEEFNSCPGKENLIEELSLFQHKYSSVSFRPVDIIFSPGRIPFNIFQNNRDTLILAFEMDGLSTQGILEFTGVFANWYIDEFSIFTPQQGLVGVRLWWD